MRLSRDHALTDTANLFIMGGISCSSTSGKSCAEAFLPLFRQYENRPSSIPNYERLVRHRRNGPSRARGFVYRADDVRRRFRHRVDGEL